MDINIKMFDKLTDVCEDVPTLLEPPDWGNVEDEQF